MMDYSRYRKESDPVIRLSESQKYQMICVLRDLASVDGNFDLMEAVRMRLIGLQLDLHAAKIEAALSEDIEPMEKVIKRLDVFTEEKQKKLLYQQCVSLVMANREMSPSEQQALDTLRAALRLDATFHDQVRDWVLEGMEWERRGEKLVGGPLAE